MLYHLIWKNYLILTLYDISLQKMSWPWNRGQRSPKVIESVISRSPVHSFLLVFYSNFVPKMHRFLRYSTCMYTLTLKPGWGSLKVIENYTIQSGTRDFLLTFHSNHRPISHHFRDIHIAYFCIFFSRRFLGKFDTCCQRKVATCENIYNIGAHLQSRP